MYSTQIINLAGKYRMKPEHIQAVEQSYDFITRFAFVNNLDCLNNCVMEIKDGKSIMYKDIPLKVKDTVSKAITKYGAYGVSRFYSEQMKEKKLEEFLNIMIKNRLQPKDFYEQGTITYKNLMYADSEDKTSKVTFYNENA